MGVVWRLVIHLLPVTLVEDESEEDNCNSEKLED
jgi:hypothetical protein